MASKALLSSQRWLKTDSVTKNVLLASGRYAKEVWVGRFKGKSCIVKVPKDKDLEVYTLDSLLHPNLVHVMGIWEDPSEPGSFPCVVMEMCKMTLPHYLRDNKSEFRWSLGSTSPTEIKIQILLGVVRGLIYLHHKDVFHGDLRSSKLFIQPKYLESDIPLVKISDYGFSQHVDPLTKARRAEILCDEDFLPPEILCDRSMGLKNAILTPQVDVFMFGDVALETATLDPVSRKGKVRETEANGKVVLTEVQRRTESFQKIEQLGDKHVFIRLINQCLAEKPEQRLSTSDIEGTLQTHLNYYQGHSDATELQNKTVECEKLRAENRSQWDRVQKSEREVKALQTCSKMQPGTMEDGSSVNLDGYAKLKIKYEDEVHAHTAEKDALRKQVQQAKEMMEATVEEMKHRDAKIAELQSQLHCSEVDRDKLHQAKTDWTEERLTLKEQLKDMQDELSKFKQSQKKMSTFGEMLSHDKQLVADLKTAVALGKESVTTQFVEVQVRVNEIKKDILRALHDAMQVLENQLKTKFELDTADLNQQVRSLTQDKATLMSNLRQTQDRHKEAQQSYSSSQVMVDQQGKTVREQAAKIKELEEQLCQAQDLEAGLKRSIADMNAQITQLNKDREKSEEKHREAFQNAIDILTKHRDAAVVATIELPPINGAGDIISALKKQLDSEWKMFGLFLGVEASTLDNIEASRSHEGVSVCMMYLVRQWLRNDSGTGNKPRTWETVVKAVNDTGSGFAHDLAETFGLSL